MTQPILHKQEYTLAGQQTFAELSGDFNPLHINPIIARREFLGDVVAHGLHCVFDALEQYCASRRPIDAPMELTKLAVKFPGAVYLNRPTAIRLVHDHNGHVKIKVENDEETLVTIDMQWTPGSAYADIICPNASPEQSGRQPMDLSFDDLHERTGAMPLYLSHDRIQVLFPCLSAIFPHRLLAELMAITRLVGMECPGLRSIFSAFDIAFHSPVETAPDLFYEVTRTDDRYALVFLNISGAYLTGQVRVIFRPPPQQQATMEAVQQLVTEDEFRGHRALIVGGSRGIGEVTAKIIAAGGGHPFVTYYQGRTDAECIADEIRANNGLCSVLSCDVNDPMKCLAALAETVNLPPIVYYFASPKIFNRKSSVYNRALYTQFNRYYIDGFMALYQAYRTFNTHQVTLFYPSSTALDAPVRNLAEYTAAKSAGEALCQHLCVFDSNLVIILKRLPRIATDQTTTLVPQPAEDALDIMVDIVREMQHAHLDTR